MREDQAVAREVLFSFREAMKPMSTNPIGGVARGSGADTAVERFPDRCRADQSTRKGYSV
jgi:hypothetical protein